MGTTDDDDDKAMRPRDAEFLEGFDWTHARAQAEHICRFLELGAPGLEGVDTGMLATDLDRAAGLARELLEDQEELGDGDDANDDQDDDDQEEEEDRDQDDDRDHPSLTAAERNPSMGGRASFDRETYR